MSRCSKRADDRTHFGLVITALLILLMASASASAAEPVTLSVFYEYTTGSMQAGVEKVLKEFDAQNPDIELQIQGITQKRFPQILQTRLAAGDQPDVAFTVTARITNYAAAGLLADLTPYLPEGFLDQFNPANVMVHRQGDTIIGAPVSSGIRAAAYNKTAFDEAGITLSDRGEETWTWDEMVGAAKKLQNARLVRYGLQFEKPSFDGWISFLYQNGGQLVKDGQPAIEQPAGVGAIDWTVDLHEDGIAAPGILEGTEDPLALFAAGFSGIWLSTGSWMVPGLEQQVANFDYAFTWLPKREKTATVTFGNDVIAFKGSHVAESARLIKFVTSAEKIATISNAMGNFPARPDAKNIQFPRPDLVPVFVEQALHADPLMASHMIMPFYGHVRDQLLRELQEAIIGKKSASQAASKMSDVIAEGLAEFE